jgi:citrate synthase
MGKKAGWWNTEIIDVKPDVIIICGYEIQDLMGRISYGEMLYLMLKGQLPNESAGRLIDAILLAACDQGVVSPAITASSMAATCGVTFNCAVASGMNLLGKIHGGAIEEAMEILYDVVRYSEDEGKAIKESARDACLRLREQKKFMPGYGHPLHKEDPRTTRLWKMAESVVKKREISGKYIEAAKSIYEAMKEITGKHLTINIDGSAAAILCELEIPSEVASGFICLSRGLGLVAHAYEEIKSGKRMKAPMPPDLLCEHMTYTGPERRALPPEREDLP